MRVVSLDDREFEWRPRGRQSLFGGGGSGLHKKCRELLKDKYPTATILEEVSIPVTKKRVLYLDFYIPSLMIAYEVQGQQHFSFNSKFHKTKAAFLKQKKNDKDKKEWCEINNIIVTELRFDEVDEWIHQI